MEALVQELTQTDFHLNITKRLPSSKEALQPQHTQ